MFVKHVTATEAKNARGQQVQCCRISDPLLCSVAAASRCAAALRRRGIKPQRRHSHARRILPDVRIRVSSPPKVMLAACRDVVWVLRVEQSESNRRAVHEAESARARPPGNDTSSASATSSSAGSGGTWRGDVPASSRSASTESRADHGASWRRHDAQSLLAAPRSSSQGISQLPSSASAYVPPQQRRANSSHPARAPGSGTSWRSRKQ